MKKNKIKTPTSKTLTYVVTWIWVLTTIFACGCLILGYDASTIFFSVSGTFAIVLNGFFAKSFLENKEQYKHGDIDFTEHDQP